MKHYITDSYGLKKDIYNSVRPEKPLQCDGLRLNVLPRQGKCMGILEIQIGFEDEAKD